jgi:hypothetical protein
MPLTGLSNGLLPGVSCSHMLIERGDRTGRIGYLPEQSFLVFFRQPIQLNTVCHITQYLDEAVIESAQLNILGHAQV